jgi:peptidoglycan DL-endopeptidase RipA
LNVGAARSFSLCAVTSVASSSMISDRSASMPRGPELLPTLFHAASLRESMKATAHAGRSRGVAMAKGPLHWLSAQVSRGITEMPRNGAWVLSKMLDSSGSPREGAASATRRVSARVADVLPGHDSVEARLKRAEVAVARSKQAEQAALADAREADNLAQTAKEVAEQGRQQIREMTQDGKQEVERRAQEVRRSLEHEVAEERERAGREVADRLERIKAEVQDRTNKSRQDAEEAAARAQQRIAQAHEELAKARALAAEATRAAQEAADQARRQARVVAEHADRDADTADRALDAARSTEQALAHETARAVRAEQAYTAPQHLTEHTKAELLEIAQPLDIAGARQMTKVQLVRSIQRASKAKART